MKVLGSTGHVLQVRPIVAILPQDWQVEDWQVRQTGPI